MTIEAAVVSTESPRSRYHIDALAKGLRVLALFDERRTALSLTDAALELGLPLPSVFRLAMTLEAEGYLRKLPSGEYSPAAQVLALGFAALRGSDLVQLASGPLQRMATETGQTVNLGVLDGDQVLYLIRIRNTDLVTANIQVGSRLPAAHTSMGKVLLADLSISEVALRLGASALPATSAPNAARSIGEVIDQLPPVGVQGWAIQDEEVARGLRSVAAPIRDGSGQVVAAANIAVAAHEVTLDRLLGDLRDRVVATCEEISRLAGAR